MLNGLRWWPAVLAIAIAMAVAPVGFPEARAEGKRLALVVGVKEHDAEKLDLPSAEDDAKKVAGLLEGVHGFAKPRTLLSSRKETKRSSIIQEWGALVDQLSSSQDVLVFYFAGHGIELKGRNYLLPSDIPAKGESIDLDAVTRNSVDFQAMIEALAVKQTDYPGIVGVFILDACRENLFPLDQEKLDTVPVGLGATSAPPRELFILYSAGIGQQALDGSIFTSALEKYLADKDLPLSNLAQSVRLDVYERAYPHPQTPAYYDQLQASRTIAGVRKPQLFVATKPLTLPWKLTAGDVVIECSHCPEMVVIGPGKLDRGSPESDRDAAGAERPQRAVAIPRAFAIGRFEVTNREWDACVRENGCPGQVRVSPERSGEALKPVTGVSWEAARQYTQWLTLQTRSRYRLPTEAEWEFAARAGTTTPYAFDLTRDRSAVCLYANGADRDMGVLPSTYQHCSDGVGRETGQVGRYRPNKWGLHDMHGNVWEWVEDCWHPSYEGAPTDGSARTEGTPGTSCSMRVARGGSWRSNLAALRSASRNAFAPTHSRRTLGFRVVREVY